MSSLIWPVFVLVLFAVAAFGALWGWRAYTTGDTSMSLAWLFPPRPEPRLSVVEQASIDGKRKLVLIRRDDVEHLIMTGGPVDVLIEDKIAAPAPPAFATEREIEPERAGPTPPLPPVFSRRRSFGQAVNE
jgi:flagellar protein FliO/FliZ